MKATYFIPFTATVLVACGPSCLAQPVLPDATISVGISPSTVDVGQTFTVTCRLTSYRLTQEVDVFAFVVNYNLKALSAVQGSFYLGTNTGPEQQFLSKANQESVTNGFTLTNLCDASRPGRAYVTVADAEVRVPPERGSIASNGFLVSFQMTALAPGSWSLTATQYSDAVFYNTFHQPISANVSFGSPTIVVRNPTAITVQAVDASASEPGEDTAMFLFTRTGPTNEDAVARFNVTGTAVEGDGHDYEYLIGHYVVIPAGSSNASAIATPIDDTEIEGDETVTVTLWTPGDYEIAGSGTATVTIHDDENMPPIVALTSPAPGTIFPNPTNITLTATASDSNGSVTNVEFYREGTIKLGEDASSPYSIVWSNAPPGPYVLTAKAADNLGATADSLPISITVRGPPSVTLTCPTNLAATGSATVTANATDPDGMIAFIEIRRDGTVWAATNGASITRIWTNAAPGTYTLSARAGDDRGLLTTSAPVIVTVTAAGIQDIFQLRPFLTGFTNYATGDSTGFTRASDEPVHGTEAGYRSGWIAWTAPASGAVTMDTFGSSFDTVLVVYTNGPSGPPGMSNLVPVEANNNYTAGTEQSRVDFSGVVGQTYAVVVDGNLFGQSGTIHLHIYQSNAAPVITSSPQSQVATVGDNVTFTVSASGGTLTYQWRWNGTNLSGATASSVTLTNVALTNAGIYDALVSNSGGSVASAPAVLVVRAPADFTTLPTNQVVNPGGTANFTVTATGSDPLNYQWSFKGVLMPGEVTNSYTRYNAQHADGGTYQVTVANAAGSASAAAELIVRPTFTSLTPSNGILHLNWFGTTGKVYIVEGTTNLNPPSTAWTTLGTVTNTALQAQFQVSLTNPPARVIRLRLGP